MRKVAQEFSWIYLHASLVWLFALVRFPGICVASENIASRAVCVVLVRPPSRLRRDRNLNKTMEINALYNTIARAPPVGVLDEPSVAVCVCAAYICSIWQKNSTFAGIVK